MPRHSQTLLLLPWSTLACFASRGAFAFIASIVIELIVLRGPFAAASTLLKDMTERPWHKPNLRPLDDASVFGGIMLVGVTEELMKFLSLTCQVHTSLGRRHGRLPLLGR